MNKPVLSYCFIKKLFFVLFFVVVSLCVNAETADGSSSATNTSFDWDPVIEAIIQVESNGNTRAQHGSSAGALQITPVLLRECNNILKRKKSKKRFKLSDRFNLSKSKEMFLLIQSVYNPLNNIETAIRSWNGGIHYSVKRTERYFNKVMSLLKIKFLLTGYSIRNARLFFCVIAIYKDNLKLFFSNILKQLSRYYSSDRMLNGG